ncbi:uncharacterized protein LOC143666869 [Tamandua tetradactyla]|uniref:uncharacterized protein LOC143666869 n=1 Tax=Tamandua tetradactyla TaxID=48850 RepID=UPI004053CD99
MKNSIMLKDLFCRSEAGKDVRRNSGCAHTLQPAVLGGRELGARPPPEGPASRLPSASFNRNDAHVWRKWPFCNPEWGLAGLGPLHGHYWCRTLQDAQSVPSGLGGHGCSLGVRAETLQGLERPQSGSASCPQGLCSPCLRATVVHSGLQQHVGAGAELMQCVRGRGWPSPQGA